MQWFSGALSSGVKRLGREANHSYPSSAEVENAWSYTSAPPICLHNLHRDGIGTEVSCKNRFPFFSSVPVNVCLSLGKRSRYRCISHWLWNIKKKTGQHKPNPSVEWHDVTWIGKEARKYEGLKRKWNSVRKTNVVCLNAIDATLKDLPVT
jgi:hypothetical protein